MLNTECCAGQVSAIVRQKICSDSKFDGRVPPISFLVHFIACIFGLDILHLSVRRCLLSPSMVAMNLADEEVDVAKMVQNNNKVSLVAFGFR